MSPGQRATTSLSSARSAVRRSRATARTAATCATFDGMFSQVPKPSCSARRSWTASRHSATSASTASRLAAAAAANRGRAPSVELVECAECAGHDDEAPAGPEARREGAQYAGGRQVVRLGDGVDLAGRVRARAHPRARVREEDVDRAELGGQRLDGAAVADVQDAAFDAGAGGRDGSRRGADAVGIAAGEQDAVMRVHAGGERFHERAAEALVGPRDEGGASVCHASTVVPRETCR